MSETVNALVARHLVRHDILSLVLARLASCLREANRLAEIVDLGDAVGPAECNR